MITDHLAVASAGEITEQKDAAVARDIEMTKLCAEAMALRVFVDAYGSLCIEQLDILSADNVVYDPLHDDAQAMALVKRLRLQVAQDETRSSVSGPADTDMWTDSADLNRAIVECVSKLHASPQLGQTSEQTGGES